MDALWFSETSVTTNRCGVTCQKTWIVIFICYYYRSVMYLKFASFLKGILYCFCGILCCILATRLERTTFTRCSAFAARPISLTAVNTVLIFLSVEFLFSPRKLTQVGQIRSLPVPINSSFYAYWYFSYSLCYMKKYHYNWLYVKYFYIFLHHLMMAFHKSRNT